MISINEIKKIIGNKENEELEYKAVLPPSRTMAMLIASFANTKGGYIILGVTETPNSHNKVVGLSQDFRAKEIIQKSQELLFPKPVIYYEYLIIENKQIFVVKVEKSTKDILYDNKKYLRSKNGELSSDKKGNHQSSTTYIDNLYKVLNSTKRATGSFDSFKQHYLNIASILDDVIQKSRNKDETLILKRILFSSCVDTFEKYLSDILYEIFLANPNTMKSEEIVTIKEVLECADIQEFIIYFAGKKLQKLQKGNIKGFLKDAKQLSDLNAIDETALDEVSKILEIRHLFTHRNGVADQKFLSVFSNKILGEIVDLSIKELCEKLNELVNVTILIDTKAIEKHGLSTI